MLACLFGYPGDVCLNVRLLPAWNSAPDPWRTCVLPELLTLALLLAPSDEGHIDSPWDGSVVQVVVQPDPGPMRPGAIHPSDTVTRFANFEPEVGDLDGWLPGAMSPLTDAPPPPEPAPEPEPEPEEPSSPEVVVADRSVWDRLADCESGNWINGGASFEEGSARWAWGGSDPIPPWGTSIHDGGLQFHPDTWNWLKPDGYPARAYDATREQQIAVAEKVLAVQGWRAWPVCSKKLGLR